MLRFNSLLEINERHLKKKIRSGNISPLSIIKFHNPEEMQGQLPYHKNMMIMSIIQKSHGKRPQTILKYTAKKMELKSLY